MVRRGEETVEEGAVGQIKFFKSSRGYGFIQVLEPESIDEDVFLHVSDCKSSSVAKNWWMKFDIVEEDKGLRAVNLRRISQPPEHELFGTNFNY